MRITRTVAVTLNQRETRWLAQTLGEWLKGAQPGTFTPDAQQIEQFVVRLKDALVATRGVP